MILKTLNYLKGKQENHEYEEWTYVDNITEASCYFDEDIKMTVVCCSFRDGDKVTVAIPNVAYLMSDSGKTVDRFVAANVEELGDTEPVYNTLIDALAAARED